MNNESSQILDVIQLVFNKFKEQNFEGSIETDEIFVNEEDLSDGLPILDHLEKKGCFRLIQYTSSEPDNPFSDLIVHNGEFKFRLQDVNSLNLFNYQCSLKGETTRPFIKPLALEKIARDMGNTQTANELIDMLHECGVPKFLIVYPNTKWRMIKDVLVSLASSLNEEAHDILFRVLEEYCHPIRFGGGESQAQAKQDEISNLLKYDGFCFKNGKIVELNDQLKEELRTRNEQREKGSSNLDFNAFSELFGFLNKKEVSPTPPPPESKLNPINITINNQNLQNTFSSQRESHNETSEKNLVFEADISKKFEIWVKGHQDRKWGLKKKDSGEFFVTGENMVKLLKNLGKGLISREDKENIVKTLANNLSITPEQARNIFFNENGKYGILKSYIVLI